ncbi:MAG: M14 family zinc carboxypeptidase [Candidatus Zixiibacteriota bacterium]
MKIILHISIVLFVVLILVFTLQSAETATKMQVRVYFENKTEFIGLSELPLDKISFGENYVDIIAGASELASLQASGFSTEIIHEDLIAYYQSGFDPALDMGGYKTLTEMYAYLDAMIADHPEIISDKHNIGVTIEGRPMWAVKISDNPDIEESDEPELLYTACIHAREAITPEVLLYFMDYLTDNYGIDPEVTWLVDNRQMWFIVMVNPDGYYYNEVTAPDGGGTWRKNRRNNGDDFYGVDLNRNFGYAWGYNDAGSSWYPGSETYRGTAPFSEPESQNIRDFVESHDFRVSVFYHSSGNQVLWSWCYERLYTPDHPAFLALGDSISAMNGYETGTSPDILYPVNGGSDDWMYGEQTTKNKCMALTFEVGSSFWPPTEAIDSLCQLNLGPNLFLARVVDNIFLPNPPAEPFAYVTGEEFVSDFNIYWTHNDSLNPAIDFDIEEFRGFQLTTDTAISLENWKYKDFTFSSDRAFSGSRSYYSGTGNGVRSYIQTQVPYLVQTGTSLTFYTYYDLEEGWDYAYVEISLDGVSFTSIPGNITTDENPHGYNLGHGITGTSSAWMPAEFDLSAFVGQEILFRLACYTDSYVYNEGIYFDNIHPAGIFDRKRVYSNVADTVLECLNRYTDDYYFRLKARDAENDMSTYSNMVHVSVEGTFYCGDVNCSNELEPDIADITRIIDYLYLSHSPLCNPEAADVNGSGGEPDISDITSLISYLYLEGPDLIC